MHKSERCGREKKKQITIYSCSGVVDLNSISFNDEYLNYAYRNRIDPVYCRHTYHTGPLKIRYRFQD